MFRGWALLAIIPGLLGGTTAHGRTDPPHPAAATAETGSAEDASEPIADADTDDDLAAAQPADAHEYADGPKEVLDEDAVFKQAAPRPRIRDVLLPARLLDTVDDGFRHFNDGLEARARLRFGFAYTLLAQWAPGADAGKQGIGGDLDFTGVWNALGSHDEGSAGYVGFATEWRHRLGPRPPSALAAQFDAFSRTTQAFNEQGFALVQLWWAQELLDDTLEVTMGKLSPRSFYNTNRLRNQNVAFLNQVFSGNRAVGLPPRGIGVNATYRPGETWYLTGGVHDANGSATSGHFGSLAEGQFASVAELGWTPVLPDLGRGSYRLTLWYSDASRERDTGTGQGFALSIDQDLDADLIAFIRYAWADGDAVDAEQTLSGGLALTPFGRDGDLVGFGAGWSRPTGTSLNDEFVTEAFYRVQLTPTQQVSFGWQAYITPAFDPDDEVQHVLSLRWRVRF